jgi:hypothetical protein
MADCLDGPVLRSARHCLDGRGFSEAVTDPGLMLLANSGERHWGGISSGALYTTVSGEDVMNARQMADIMMRWPDGRRRPQVLQRAGEALPA